jgi:hypothetical protein
VTSVLDLYAAALVRLQAIEHVTTYEGTVPEQPPADEFGYVYPYLVLFPTPGYYPYDMAASLAASSGPELDWLVQVTCVGGTQARCLQAADAARGALVGQELLPFAGPLVEQQINIYPQVDRAVKPPRIFLPLQLRCMTSA